VIGVIVIGGLAMGLAPLLGDDDIHVAAMLLLLAVLLVSAAWGYAAGLFAALVADAMLNFFFVPPLHHFTVREPGDFAALIVFLAVAVVGASMLALLRRQLAVARDRGAELTIMLLVLLDNTHASETAVRRAWRLAHAFNGELFAAYPAPLLKEQGMTHILTVALDLNATTRELPGEDLAAELSGVIAADGITHVTLISPRPSRLALPGRSSLADKLFSRHPHLEVHLLRPG
jgi:K+-sensing histidine kinase KdpD